MIPEDYSIPYNKRVKLFTWVFKYCLLLEVRSLSKDCQDNFSCPLPPHSIFIYIYHSFSAAVSSLSNLSHSYCLMDFLLFLFPIHLLSLLVLLFQWPGLGLVNNLINYWWPYTPNHLPLYPKGWDYSILFLVSFYNPLTRVLIFHSFLQGKWLEETLHF